VRREAGLERLAFFVVPSAVGFFAAGDLIAGALLESGAFTAADSRLAWYILVGSGVALWAQTSGRLYSSAFYALQDTRTPLAFAVLRVGLGVGLGYYAVRSFPGQLGLPAHLGAAFITATTGVTAWLEMGLLKRALSKAIGGVPGVAKQLARVGVAAGLAGAGTLGAKAWLTATYGAKTAVAGEWGGSFLAPPALPTFRTSMALLVLFCALYGAACLALEVPQAQALLRRALRRR
jgi:putative peptidoglycan lipid II flippase